MPPELRHLDSFKTDLDVSDSPPLGLRKTDSGTKRGKYLTLTLNKVDAGSGSFRDEVLQHGQINEADSDSEQTAQRK